MTYSLIKNRSLSFLVATLCLLSTASFGQETTAPTLEERRTAFESTLDMELPNDHYRLGQWLLDEYDAKDPELTVLSDAISFLQTAKTNDVAHAATLHNSAKSLLSSEKKRVYPDIWKMVFAVLGGLGLFLIGMKYLSDGMQAVAGARLRHWIGAVTDNRFLAVLVGTGVTCVVQSSSITTVLVVGFVNSGLMALHQAIGVIMGANIGTTVTGWILVLKIGKYGGLIIGLSALVYLFTKKERIRFIAMALLGVGLVFFGLEMMKNGFKPIKSVPAFEEAFLYFSADTYFGVLKCALIGCVLTFIVQSSSATLGITIGLAAVGAIPFTTAAALVLGENIGTTITAWLASIGTTTIAKRAAYFHVAFNLIGVFWITLIFQWYVDVVGHIVVAWQGLFGGEGLNPNHVEYGTTSPGGYAAVVTMGIACTHTCFNVANTLFFLPFAKTFATILNRLVPDQDTKETSHLTSLDILMTESPVLAIEQSRKEICKMASGVYKMQMWLGEIVDGGTKPPDEELLKKLFHREEIMDIMQKEVVVFLGDLLSGTNISHDIVDEGRKQLRMADEYESVSDYIAAIVKLQLKLQKNNMTISEIDRKNISHLHQLVSDYIMLINDGVESNRPEILSKANSQGETITQLMKDYRQAHLETVGTEQDSAYKNLIVTDILNAYRRIKDHALNIAEALAGEK